MNHNRREFLSVIGAGLAVGFGLGQSARGGEAVWTQAEGKQLLRTSASLSGVMPNRLDPYDREVGKRLQAARKARNLSQDDLARWLGKSQPSISDYEAGRTSLSPHQIRELCRLLGMSADELLGVPRLGGD